MVLWVFTGELEELVDVVGHGKEGGAGIESEAILSELGEFTAGVAIGFKNGDLVALGGHSDGGGDTADTGADDTNVHRFAH